MFSVKRVRSSKVAWRSAPWKFRTRWLTPSSSRALTSPAIWSAEPVRMRRSPSAVWAWVSSYQLTLIGEV